MGWAIPVISVRTINKNCVFGFVATVWEGSNRVFRRNSVFKGITGIAEPIMIDRVGLPTHVQCKTLEQNHLIFM